VAQPPQAIHHRQLHNLEAVVAQVQQVALLVATDFLSLGCPHHMVHLALHLVDGLLAVEAVAQFSQASAVDRVAQAVAVEEEITLQQHHLAET
jgi:hypothetical protein